MGKNDWQRKDEKRRCEKGKEREKMKQRQSEQGEVLRSRQSTYNNRAYSARSIEARRSQGAQSLQTPHRGMGLPCSEERNARDAVSWLSVRRVDSGP